MSEAELRPGIEPQPGEPVLDKGPIATTDAASQPVNRPVANANGEDQQLTGGPASLRFTDLIPPGSPSSAG